MNASVFPFVRHWPHNWREQGRKLRANWNKTAETANVSGIYVGRSEQRLKGTLKRDIIGMLNEHLIGLDYYNCYIYNGQMALC